MHESCAKYSQATSPLGVAQVEERAVPSLQSPVLGKLCACFNSLAPPLWPEYPFRRTISAQSRSADPAQTAGATDSSSLLKLLSAEWAIQRASATTSSDLHGF